MWNLKNEPKMTFWTLEIDWDVMRPSRLLPRLAMTLKNISNTLIVMRKAIEKIFRALEVTLLTWKTLLLSEILSFYCDFTWKWVWNLKNEPKMTFWTLEIDWDAMRPSRVLSRLTMFPNNLSNDLVVMWKAMTKIFKALEVTLLTRKTLLLGGNPKFSVILP